MFQGERLLLFGGSGWLGRSLLHRLSPYGLQDILVVGESSRLIILPDREIRVHSYSLAAAEDFQPSIVIHLAALTRDRLTAANKETYSETNRVLLRRGLALSRISSVSAVVSVSSGAALTDSGPYGASKREQESAFEALRGEIPAHIVNARVWSVTGRFCTKPDAFAITSMIQEAKRLGTVTVRSVIPVRRRYVDAGEFLELAMRAGKIGLAQSIDSSGALVELEQLAVRIGSIYGAEVQCSPSRVGPGDDYFTSSSSMLKVAKQLDYKFSSLDTQITRTGQDL